MLKDVLKRFKKNQKKIYKKNNYNYFIRGNNWRISCRCTKKYSDLEIGSYPYFKKNSFGVSLVITGESNKRIKEACELLITYLDKNKGNPRLF